MLRGYTQNAAKPDNFVEDALRHFALSHFRQSQVAAIPREQRHDVRIEVEACAFCRNVVCHD